MKAMGTIKDVVGNLELVAEMIRQAEAFLRTMESCSNEQLCKQIMMASGVQNALEILQNEGIKALKELVQVGTESELKVPDTV